MTKFFIRPKFKSLGMKVSKCSSILSASLMTFSISGFLIFAEQPPDEFFRDSHVSDVYEIVSKTYPNQPQFLFELGEIYYNNHEWLKAINAFSRNLQLTPENQDARLLLAYSYLLNYTSKIGLKESQELYKQVLEINPDNINAQKGLKNVNFLLESKDENPSQKYFKDRNDVSGESIHQIELYEELTKTFPNDAQFYFDLGQAYYKNKDWDKALFAYNRALELKPYNFDERLDKADALFYAYLSQSDLIESQRLFKQVLAALPDYKDAEQGLKQVEALLRNPSKKDENEAASKRDLHKHQWIESFANTAKEISKKREQEGARDSINSNEEIEKIAHYELLTHEHPNEYEYFYQLGRAYYFVQEWDKAIDAFTRALTLQPSNSDAKLMLAYARLLKYNSRSDLVRSEDLFKQILKDDPEYTEAQDGLKQIEDQLSRKPGPSPEEEEAIKVKKIEEQKVSVAQKNKEEKERTEKETKVIKEKCIVTLMEEAENLSKLGIHWGAIDIYKRLIEEYPDNAEFQYRLGREYIRIEWHCEAISALTEAVILKPDFSDALILLGNQYLIFREYFVSRDLFQRALDVAPDYVEGLVGMARTMAFLDHPACAEEYFNAAIDLDPDNTETLGFYYSFVLAQRRYSEAEDNFRYLSLMENDFDTFRPVLLDITSYTEPTLILKGGTAEEREKDLFSNEWDAAIRYIFAEGGFKIPVSDQFRIGFSGRWLDTRQHNLIPDTILFQVKSIGGGIRWEWFLNPFWTVIADTSMEWISNNDPEAILPTKHGIKFEPTLVFVYNRDPDLVTFGEYSDSIIFRDFDNNRAVVFVRNGLNVSYQHYFDDYRYFGADASWFWFQDPIYNQEQDINAWIQAGVPYFEELLSARYICEYRQFREETTGYYSFEYQLTHWLKLVYLTEWFCGTHVECEYWHGWRTTRGQNPQQQIITTPAATILPVVTVANQIDQVFFTIGYSPDSVFDVSFTGNYYHDSFDYTIYGIKMELDWRF